MELYQHKSSPFRHQADSFESTRELPRWALFWEQGCGKTKPTIDTAAYLFEKGAITALLVIAPNGVHRNWVSDEIPAHMPDRIRRMTHCYHSSKAGSKKHKQAVNCLLTAVDCLPVLAMTYDAVMTKEGERVIRTFLEHYRCMFVLDEATRIKSPNAKRTKRILALAKYANFRRVLTGTPIANGPFDAYTLMKFLDLGFWKPYQLDSFYAFKHHFGVWQVGQSQEREYEYVVAYRNLEQLRDILAKHSSRLVKADVLDLPPKLYTKRYFELNKEQLRVYRDLEQEFMTFIKDDLVLTPLAITRLLRLQQITSGYLPGSDDKLHPLGDENPRIKLLEDVIEDVTGKTITWAKFKLDIGKIMELYRSLGRKPVRYDGETGPDERAAAIEAFQRGDATDFVANPAAAGEGLTLHAANTVIYYNTGYKLTDRLQSEDRAHRIGQKNPVNYIDLVAQETIDEGIVDALVGKQEVAAKILGDRIKEWI